MHHEDIKAALRKKGVTPADLARHLKVSDQMVSGTIRGATKSSRIAAAISRVIEVPIETLWPGRYDNGRATKVQQILRTLATGPSAGSKQKRAA